jgi:hypothetical protein
LEAGTVNAADRSEEMSGEPPFEEAQAALDRIELVNVVPTIIHADTHDNPNAARDVRFEVGAQINVAPGAFGNRFRYKIELLDDDEHPTATLDFEFQVEYEVKEDFEPSREVAEFLTRTTGLFAAYPYARELAQTLTARLQQDPLVLGLMPRGAGGPSRVTTGAGAGRGASDGAAQSG